MAWSHRGRSGRARNPIEGQTGEHARHDKEQRAINKKEVVARYAQKQGIGREESQSQIVSLLETIAEGLMIDEEVVISNFGVFQVVEPTTREFTLPKGEKVPSRTEMKVKFRPSRNLTRYVNGDKVSIATNASDQ